MSSQKYNKGDQLIVTKGDMSGIVGKCVGYSDNGKVKVGFRLEVGDGYLAVLTIPENKVSFIQRVE